MGSRVNKSLPPVKLLVRDQFLYNQNKGYGEYTKGVLVSVRSLRGQALQFSVLLETGALFTGLPAHALCFDKEAPALTIQACQMWDNISSEIDVFTIDLLRNMSCTVKLNDFQDVIGATYLFSIDYVGLDTLAATPDEWKCFHALRTEYGNLVFYPQYRIKFLDKSLTDINSQLPSYAVNDKLWTVE